MRRSGPIEARPEAGTAARDAARWWAGLPGSRGRHRRRERAEACETAELAASRAAVLLRAGLQKNRVFPALAAEHPDRRRLVAVAERSTDRGGIVGALVEQEAQEWRALAAVWLLAERSGGPLADALDRYAKGLRSLGELRDRREVLLAGPRATIRLVAALPALAIGLGRLIGFDPLGVLLTPLGAVLIVVGAALLGAGVWWAGRLAAAVEREDRVAGLEFVMLGVGLGGGSAAGPALLRLADCVDAVGARWIGFDLFCRGSALHRSIEMARAHGAPLGAMLLEEAEAAQTRAHAELERGAERLGVRVLIPLGVCALPSFIVIGVLPVLLSMLGPVV